MKKQINDLLLKMQNGENCIGETANELLNLYSVSQLYTIEDIERCVENWGLCKVEKEHIEKFLNVC